MAFVEFESTWGATPTVAGDRLFLDPQRVVWFSCFKHHETGRDVANIYLEHTNVTVFGGVEEVSRKLGIELICSSETVSDKE